jgi:hypothetical protein
VALLREGVEIMVELIALFNVERHHVIGRARTKMGAWKLVAKLPMNDGWGARFEGAKKDLLACGAEEIGDGGQLAIGFRNRDDATYTWIDCFVV